MLVAVELDKLAMLFWSVASFAAVLLTVVETLASSVLSETMLVAAVDSAPLLIEARPDIALALAVDKALAAIEVA